MPISCKTCKKNVAANATVCPNCGDSDCVYNLEFKHNSTLIEKYSMGRKIVMGIAIGTYLIAVYLGYETNLSVALFGTVMLAFAGKIYFFDERKLEARRLEINARYRELVSEEG